VNTTIWAAGGVPERRRRAPSRARVLLGLAATVALGALGLAVPHVAEAVPAGGVVVVRSIPDDEIGVEHLAGLTWSPAERALVTLDAQPQRSDAVWVDPTGHVTARIRLPASSAPGTLAYDARGRRLTLVGDGVLWSLSARGLTPPSSADLGALDVRDPRAAAFDPSTGTWLTLDDGGRTVRAIDLARAPASARPRPIPLEAGRPAAFRAISRHPSDGLLYLAGADDQRLYAYTPTGRLQTVVDLAPAGVDDLRGMVFAPTADATDDPASLSLYLADAGSKPGTGQIVEVALGPAGPAAVSAQASTSSGDLVVTRDLSELDPPSPDPSGITYLPGPDRLLVSDGEVDEMSIFENVNLYRLTRTGTLTDTGVTTAFSDEPTGLGFDPATGRLFVSDDDDDEIYVIRPGSDGRYGTRDDLRSSFDTRGFGNSDPEGVAFDTATGAVFIVDGVNREVYRRAPNGAVTHFDVGVHGAFDPEGIDYDAATGRLLVVDHKSRAVYELTTSGGLVNSIDISAADAVLAAGVVVAPASNGSGRHLYVVDRGEDNDSNPNENDGALHELTYEAPK
jgi:uncharacterized protein YjiK